MHPSCLNCNQPLNPDNHFCSNCGQGVKESRLSFIDILKEAGSNWLTLDSRLFHTLRDIFLPWKLTETYVAGKRKYYVHPIRLFLFSLLALISLFLLTSKGNMADGLQFQLMDQVEHIIIKEKLDTLNSKLGSTEDDAIFNTIRDSIFSDIDLQDEFLTPNLKINNIDIGKLKIKKVDVFKYSPDEILDKYEIEGFWDRITIKQLVKVTKDPSGGIKYAVKNFSWVILILVFVAAFLLKFLYIRKSYFYVEHLVLVLYSHATIFVLLSLFTLGHLIFSPHDIFSFILLGFIPLFEILVFKKYYKQGWIKTLLKLLMYNVVYLISFVIIISFVLLVSFLIF